MKQFSELFDKLAQTRSKNDKIQLMKNYFEAASSEDAAWVLYYLSGHKLKRLIGPSKLFKWCQEVLKLPEWLALESYAAVGDIGETISLLLANQNSQKIPKEIVLSELLKQNILPLQNLTTEFQREKIIQLWNELDQKSILILNKILTGSLRIGVSHLLTIQALSKALHVSRETLSLKLMGNWIPSAEFFDSLRGDDQELTINSLNPYPFFLASPLEGPLVDIGRIEDWIIEWK